MKLLLLSDNTSFLVLIMATQNILLSIMAIITVFSIIMVTAAILLLIGIMLQQLYKKTMLARILTLTHRAAVMLASLHDF
jgi:hypothetical protein